MGVITRRRMLWLAGAGAVGIVGARFGLPYFLRPGEQQPLSADAGAFVEAAFAGIDRSKMWDTHSHLIGLGSGGTGCWINPEMQSHLNPIQRLKYDVYVASLGMENESTADADYIRRLLELQREANPQGKLVLFAFDQACDESGTPQPELSPFYTPNDYVLRLALENPELIVPCASIHPYRVDALDRLDQVVDRGARAVKWLPNAMSIDPSSARCDDFYKKMADLGLPLISHGGEEMAVDQGVRQELGNPLRLRRALDAGVKVVVAHCASFGQSLDIDISERGRRTKRDSFDLLMRLFEEDQYKETLFADISAITQLNRGVSPIQQILEAQHLHPRLVNGSDYPIPALRILFSLARLQLAGLIDDRERRLIDELGDNNPLIFDFVLKRSLRLEKGGRTYRFADSVFETSWLFD